MATKQPLKTTEPASTPVEEAKQLPAKKSVPAKKEALAKEVPLANLLNKGEPEVKKSIVTTQPAAKKVAVSNITTAKKNTVANKPADKAVSIVEKTLQKAAKKTVETVKKTVSTVKENMPPKKEVKPKEEERAPVAAKKIVIVPPKPAKEPKVEKPVDKKVDTKKSSKPVVIPKTSTDKKVAYEPEFVKSVLDTPEEPINYEPTMRYSDNDLKEFRELINKKLDAAKKELGYLQGLITRKDEMGGDESDNRYMTMEDGSMSMEREQLSQMASRQITFIDHLEKAIMRIENKTYGICRVTGKLIDKARLRAVPHATLSMEAKLGIAK